MKPEKPYLSAALLQLHYITFFVHKPSLKPVFLIITVHKLNHVCERRKLCWMC